MTYETAGSLRFAGRNSRCSSGVKAASKRTTDRLPVHKTVSLMAGPGRLTLNSVSLAGRPGGPFRMSSRPTTLKNRVFEPPEVEPP